MENRFGVKDLIVIFLLISIIAIIGIAMVQYDRQMQRLTSIDTQLRSMNEQSASQSKFLQQISQQLASGISLNSGNTIRPVQIDTANDPKDPFVDVRKAMANADYSRGDWLVSNMGTKMSKLTPLLSSDVYASIVQNRVQESLAYRDPETFEWRPLLAQSWSNPTLNLEAWQTFIDERLKVPLTRDDVLKERDLPPEKQAEARQKYIDSRLKEGRTRDSVVNEADCPEAVTVRFQLRRGVQYSNGEPFVAADLVWTFNWIMNPAVNAPRHRAYYGRMKSVTAIGDYEVEIKFKEPYFEYFGLAASLTPMSQKFYGRFNPSEFNDKVGLLLGTGPYRLEDPENWRPGKPVVLFRNERYWGVTPTFDRVYYHEVEEDAAELTMFRNGELDIFGAQPEQYETLIKDPDITKKSQNYKYYSRDGGYSYVAWNQLRKGQPTRFADKRVRQAMTMLIDRDRLAQEIYRGFGKPAPGPFGIASKQNDPNIKPWPYDFKKANELLAEAGYKTKNSEGILLGPDGQPFKFKLIYSNKNPIGESIVLQIKASLGRAGIVLEQEPTDWPVMMQKLDQQDFDAITLGWSGGIETDIYQMFHSSQIGGGADNYPAYKNPELDKLIEQARRELDEEKRIPIWRKAHQILHEDQPYTFLLYRESLAFYDRRLKNVYQTRSGMNYVSTDDMPIPYYVPAAEQRHK
jgi:peptide/nickel transport system substrate-binding protein